MVKRLKDKMNTMLQARKENKGFTLVELIVVIVILAILIGVTIGGVYSYVNKSRINTDINNASSIQSVCATLGTNKAILKAKGKTGTVTWNTATTKTDEKLGTVTGDLGDDANEVIQKELAKLLTDGLPAPKVADKFVLTVAVGVDGNATVTCVAQDADGKALEAVE